MSINVSLITCPITLVISAFRDVSLLDNICNDIRTVTILSVNYLSSKYAFSKGINDTSSPSICLCCNTAIRSSTPAL